MSTPLERLCVAHGIVATVTTGTAAKPPRAARGWTGWTVSLTRGARALTVPFWKLHGVPTAVDVLARLLDATAEADQFPTFVVWARATGASEDSIQAKEAHRVARSTALQTRRFLRGVFDEFASAKR